MARIQVPEVLLSGHHENIAKWRLSERKRITQDRRADYGNDINIFKKG